VRSVRKTRRQGAPVQVVVGDRGTSLALVLTDKKAHGGIASAVATMDAPLPEGSRVTVSTAHDLEGDGTLEVVVGAERPDGSQLRQVFHLSFDAPMAVTVGMGVQGSTPICTP
jgi:hypothetical protein